MSKAIHMCGESEVHLTECSECADYESRIKRLEDCCDEVQDALDGKQDTLVSGQNIKTINNQSLLGEGNIDIQGGSGDTVSYTQTETSGDELGVITINGTAKEIFGQEKLVAGTNLKTINNQSLLGSGNITVGGGGGGGVIVSPTAPTGDSSMLWVDTGNGGIANYWNGTAWTPILAKAVWE